MRCSSCDFAMGTSQVCSSCGHDHRENKTNQVTQIPQSVSYKVIQVSYIPKPVSRIPHSDGQCDYSSEEMRFLRRRLSILFWLFITSMTGSILTGFDSLRNVGIIITIVTSLGYGLILLRLSKIMVSYGAAGKFYTISALLSLIMVILIMNTEGDLFIFLLFTVLNIMISLFGIHYECDGHSYVIFDIDDKLSHNWTLLWKWYLGLYSVHLIAAILPIFSTGFSFPIMLFSLIGLAIAGIVKLDFLARTAKRFYYSEFTEYRGKDIFDPKR